jgi:TctA family transporter
VIETLQSLALGFSVALSPAVLLYAFVGCVVGTLVGVLPGVGPLAVGLFGLAEVFATAGQAARPEVLRPRLRELLPSRQEWRESVMRIGRGTVLGFLFGIVPGSAHIISSFVAYAVERRLVRRPEEFGQGAGPGWRGRSRPTTA